MLKSHEKFHSTNGKRLILVADDEQINRELLGMVLQADYEVVFARDGQETVEKVRQLREDLSLVLLDLMMPRKSGREALKEIKEDPELRFVPVIVLTADQNSEVESLSLGAIDYIPKPYPQADIILARVRKAIELSEDRDIIQSTERDPLTGLYNREYFYRYAEQYDQHHRDREMDAIVIDVNHFHMINERFGNAYGDEVLRHIGEQIRAEVSDADGIVCRRSADTFMVYCTHGKDYRRILDHAAIGLAEGESVNSRVRLRMGVYARVDRQLEIQRRFDRAKMAADTVRNSFTKNIGIYDSKMHEQQLFSEQLIDDFHQALQEKQFQVFFQPKFDIRPDTPVLSSAEALVRWQHPKHGMVSPGVFIPLFEENGLIQALDRYVWQQSAARIGAWKKRFGVSLPVSVNVSRVDMYDPDLCEYLESLLRQNDLKPEELLLEITESAYTKDSDQIVNTVNALRERGFRIEMDDFGTGYSSLNMISSLPLDALKLDMQFVRSAFQDQRDTRMLEVIIDIADHLSVPVIAEGVETEEQLHALRDLGCDIVQGYYFSKPLPPEEFERFLVEKSRVQPETVQPEAQEAPAAETAPKPARERRPIRLQVINYIFVLCAVLLAVALGVTSARINESHGRMDEATAQHERASQAARDLAAGSDYLTVSVRAFVFRGDLRYVKDYFDEVHVTRRRETAVSDLQSLLAGRGGSEAASYLALGLQTSNALMKNEYQAMRLTQLALGISDAEMPEEVLQAALTPEELAMSPEQKRARAEELVLGDEYLGHKDQIRDYVTRCSEELIRSTDAERTKIRAAMDRMMRLQMLLLVLIVLVGAGEVLFIALQIRLPLARMVKHMRNQEPAVPQGAEELQFVTRTYNEILEETRKTHSQLSFKASHDPLTGVYNRGTFEQFICQQDLNDVALVIADVDKFKRINDTFGHEMGDKVLREVAETLKKLFRSEDMICRYGGDEFVVIMMHATPDMRETVLHKMETANTMLRQCSGLPDPTLSVGISFSGKGKSGEELFREADAALYRVKQNGGSGCEVH